MVLSLFIFFLVNGQSSKIDSLLSLLANDKLEFSNPILFKELGTQYFRQGNKDSALYYYKQGYLKALEKNNDLWVCKMALQQGSFFAANVQYDSASKYLDEGFKLLQKRPNDSLYAQYYNTYGAIFIYQNNFDKATEYNLKAIGILEKMGSKQPPNLLIPSINNLAICLENAKQFEQAIFYYKKGLANKDLLSDAQKAALYYNVASLYKNLSKFENLKLYLDTAAFYNKQQISPDTDAGIKMGYGIFYNHKGDAKKAIGYFLEAYNTAKIAGDSYFMADVAIDLAAIYLNNNQLESAISLLEEHIPISIEFKNHQQTSLGYKILKEINLKKRDFKKAYEFAALERAYYDSSTNNETQNTILALDAKYQNQKKEKEIADLTIANNEKELTVVKRNRALFIGGISTAAILLVLGLLYRNSKHKQTAAVAREKLQEAQIQFLERQQQVVSLQSMLNGQETERTRIAKDLHDGLGGLFSTVKMYFSTLEHEQPALQQNELFRKSYDMVNTSATELRRIAHNMMPEVLMKMGLNAALKDLCNSISGGGLLQVSLVINGMNERLNASTEIMLYRILQELLNNIIKHAQATEVIVQFIQGGERLSVTVEDNGRGFNTAETERGKTAGMESIKSRVNYLKGKLAIESEQGMGTTVMMDFLINQE